MDEESLEDILEDLATNGIYGSAVVDREGTMVVSDLPAQVNTNTFSIMCATVMGAARAANSELSRTPLNKVEIDTEDGRIILVSAGRKLILSLVVDAEQKIETVYDLAYEAADKIKGMN